MCPLLTLGERWRELGTADTGVARSLGVLFREQSKDRRRLCGPTAARKGLKSRLPRKNNLKKSNFLKLGLTT